MRLKLTIVATFDVGEITEKDWPGCKTPQDVADKQKEFLDDGSCGKEDILSFADIEEVRIEPE